MLSVLKTRDYRLLFAGQSVSALGDQFNLIALPWLVLTLTREPLQLGLVLAAAGVPRAALMLVGGAWADRHSPRTIMLVADGLRFALAAALAIAILTGTAQMWMVYVLALAFGIVSGFFLPAAESVVPRLLPDAQLEGGNSLIMGTNQLAGFVGPAAAGLLIAALGAGSQAAGETASLAGIGLAFAVDAGSFLVSAVFLAMMGPLPALNAAADTHPLSDITEGLRYAWGSERIRWMVVLLACANVLFMGPMLVGLPVIAQARLAGGAAALGTVLSAHGLGALAGMIMAAVLPRPDGRVFSWLVVALMAGFGVAVGSLGFVHATWVAAALMFASGVGNGYIGVIAMTSVQRMTDKRFLGRVMSLIMLSVVGLVPVSQVVAGAIVAVSPTALFVGAAAGFLGLAMMAAARRSMWITEDGVSLTAVPSLGGVV